MFISNQVLKELLEKATEEEKLSLTKILKPSQAKSYSSNKLQELICEEGGNGLANLCRSQGTSYLDIVYDVASELGIKSITSYSGTVKYFDKKEELKYDEDIAEQKGIKYAEDVEEKIILNLLGKVYENLDSTKKEEFDKQITTVAQDFDSNLTSKLSGATGLIVLGNLGGFATYTFLTSALSTISFGTLSFGAYTAATTALGVALGPAGWTALCIVSIYALSKPEYEKLIPIVAIIGAIRQRIKYENNITNKGGNK